MAVFDTISGDAFMMPQGLLIPSGGAEVNMDVLQDWGTMTLQLFDCRCGEFCITSVWCTPVNPSNHGRQIRRVVDNCTSGKVLAT